LPTRFACYRRTLFVGMAIFLALFISGCTTTTTTAPFYYSNNSNYDFIILGEVTYENSSKIGFQELLKAARSKYKDCDYVIDIMIDSETTTTTSILSFLFPPSVSVKYIMRGIAIQYIQNIPEGSEISSPAQNPVTGTRASTQAVIADNSTRVSTPVIITDRSTGAPPARISIADSYTVERLSGQVHRYSGDRWVFIRVGEELGKDTRIRTGMNSSLVLVNGSTTITIPAGNIGSIDSLIASGME